MLEYLIQFKMVRHFKKNMKIPKDPSPFVYSNEF